MNRVALAGGLFLAMLQLGAAQERLVVSVDEHGAVTSAPAEPVRW